MANALYPVWKQELMQATANSALNGSGATGVYVALVDTGIYTYNAAHQFYASLIASPDAVIGTDQEIGATKTYTNGTFDGADLTYTAVTGATVEALVGYVHNAGANTTWRLVFYFDSSVTGLPVTPNGGNITVTWSGSGIFTLSEVAQKEAISIVGSIGIATLYEYNYRNTKDRQVGFLAHEVEQFAPRAVRKIGGLRHVDYGEAIREAVRLAA
jgi:hypothetical protein